MTDQSSQEHLTTLTSQAIEVLEGALNGSSSSSLAAAKEILDRSGFGRNATPRAPLLPPTYVTHALPGLLRLTGAPAATITKARAILEAAERAQIEADAAASSLPVNTAPPPGQPDRADEDPVTVDIPRSKRSLFNALNGGSL